MVRTYTCHFAELLVNCTSKARLQFSQHQNLSSSAMYCGFEIDRISCLVLLVHWKASCHTPHGEPAQKNDDASFFTCMTCTNPYAKYCN